MAQIHNHNRYTDLIDKVRSCINEREQAKETYSGILYLNRDIKKLVPYKVYSRYTKGDEPFTMEINFRDYLTGDLFTENHMVFWKRTLNFDEFVKYEKKVKNNFRYGNKFDSKGL
jgi:hypothetical protein